MVENKASFTVGDKLSTLLSISSFINLNAVFGIFYSLPSFPANFSHVPIPVPATVRDALNTNVHLKQPS